jgi:hypothetical protein
MPIRVNDNPYMKNTTTPPIRPNLCGLVLALAVIALSSYVAQATPYASGVVSNNNTVTFVLNQNAQGLVVLRNGANPVSPGTTAGQHSFDMTGFTTYSIIVTGNTATAWTQISADSLTQSKYYSPRGVTVDRNPMRSTFGQIIVAEASGGAVAAGGRTTTDGLYIMSADQGDVHGQGNTAYAGGIDWTTGGSASPWKVSMNSADPTGQDYTIYIADWSDTHSGIWTANALNPSAAFNVLLDNTGRDANGLVLENLGAGPNPLHGSVASGPWVEGTGANRKMYTIDEDVRLGNVLEYDIGTTTSGYATAPIDRVTNSGLILNSDADAVRDADGSWWIAQYRYTDSGSVPSLSHWADGASAPSWTSGPSTVPLDLAYGSIDIFNDDHLLVMGTLGGGIYVLNISDPDNPKLVGTIASPGDSIRDVAFDAAGNIYAVNNTSEKLRIYSPGGYTVANTKSDGTFTLTKPSVNVSMTVTTGSTSMDLNQPPAVFTLSRSGDSGVALPVGYTLTGTATNGVQFQLLSGTATFPAGSSSTDVLVTAKPYSPAGPTRSVILTINTSNTYSPTAPTSGTVWIIDTNKPAIHASVRDTQFYERTNDLARFTLTRLGDTNVYLSQINVTYGGTATAGTQFYGDANTYMSNGDETKDVFVYPIRDGVITGPLTVTATVAPASDDSYTVGTPATSGAITRVDAEDPPETVLWSDDFSTDTSANWTILYATTNGVAPDYCINAQPDGYSAPLIGPWPFDYSPLQVPSAPHTKDGSTHGLYMTVNKDDTVLAAAALNFYPKGQSFSGNYALRFDMYLMENSSTSTTEYSLFGINHSGTKTNWFRGSTAGFTGVDPVGWNFDGVFYAVEADASGTDDYIGYSSPMAADHNPTPIAPGVGATALAGVFKAPPWAVGGTGGGSAANVYNSTTPIWADVEVKQVNGVIYWSINHTLIFAYTNTTGYTSGNIMLGYTDAYDSIGGTGGGVIFANARVISLARPLLTKVVRNGSNAEITFTANAGDVPAQFVLQSASLVNSGYADTSSTITALGGGTFKAVKAVAGNQQFYRIRRIE